MTTIKYKFINIVVWDDYIIVTKSTYVPLIYYCNYPIDVERIAKDAEERWKENQYEVIDL